MYYRMPVFLHKNVLSEFKPIFHVEDAYTVPRTPVAVDKQSTPTFTPLCRQINYNSTRASLYNHFATPRNATPYRK